MSRGENENKTLGVHARAAAAAAADAEKELVKRRLNLICITVANPRHIKETGSAANASRRQRAVIVAPVSRIFRPVFLRQTPPPPPVNRVPIHQSSACAKCPKTCSRPTARWVAVRAVRWIESDCCAPSGKMSTVQRLNVAHLHRTILY